MTERILDSDQMPASEAQELACEDVEWLAALWELTEERESRTANPRLFMLLRFASRLHSHPAVSAVFRARSRQSRDKLIKAIVRDAYGEPSSPPELRAALTSLRAERKDLLGREPCRLIDAARRRAVRRVEVMAGQLDPAADLAALTGEYVPLRVALAPSIFLPPPQSGRHGVLLRRADHWVAHLHFGFPLEGDLETYGINRPWLLGGAWHYAIDLFLDRDWPAVAERLAGRRDLADAVSASVEALRQGEADSWIRALRNHLSVAFKCLLARQQGVPDVIHRTIARASGLSLFPWFEEWLTYRMAAGQPLREVVRELPDALAADLPRWSAPVLAELPPTVNLALISPAARRTALVVPDEWSDEVAEVAVAGWRLLRLPVLRYGEWRRVRATGVPVIAFGEPGGNPLVGGVLAQRGLSLDTLHVAEPAIIALSTSAIEEAPWCVAVAVERPETAAMVPVEIALRQTAPYVLLDGPAVIGLGSMTLDELVPPRSLAPRTGRTTRSDGISGDVVLMRRKS